jgi:hypothetical protein
MTNNNGTCRNLNICTAADNNISETHILVFPKTLVSGTLWVSKNTEETPHHNYLYME